MPMCIITPENLVYQASEKKLVLEYHGFEFSAAYSYYTGEAGWVISKYVTEPVWVNPEDMIDMIVNFDEVLITKDIEDEELYHVSVS